MTTRRILIVGGSTRAAADSVRRAGCQPVCADLFADLDLRHSAEVIQVEKYPDSLPADVANAHADAWFYTGALENHPDILEQLLNSRADYGPLLGSPPESIRSLRDPRRLTAILRSAGFEVLDVVDQSNPPEPDGTWIQKPIATAGGRSIRIWDQTATSTPFGERFFFQRRTTGIGMSAVYMVRDGHCGFLGASQEIGDNPQSRPPTPFAYCGSMGPIGLADSIRTRLDSIMNAIINASYGLRGLVGLDFRLDGNQIWLTEVNPRYTASIEVLELAYGRSLLDLTIGRASQEPRTPTTAQRYVAKKVIYAAKPYEAPNLSRFVMSSDPWRVPMMADIPMHFQPIGTGWPICSVLAEADTLAGLEENLQRRADIVLAELFD